jgi:predicted DNA-binding transcriptional regulator AlpA
MQIHSTSPDASPFLFSPRMLSLAEVCDQTGLSKSTIRRLELSDAFPRRRQLSPWRVAWLSADVDTWLQTRQPAPLSAA